MSDRVAAMDRAEPQGTPACARCVPMFLAALVVEIGWLLFLFWMTLR